MMVKNKIKQNKIKSPYDPHKKKEHEAQFGSRSPLGLNMIDPCHEKNTKSEQGDEE